jgi:hypothetical protein
LEKGCFVLNYTFLSRYLKSIAILIAIMVIIFYFGMIPDMIKDMAINFPVFSYLVKPGIILIQISVIPIIIALLSTWKICTNVHKHQFFCVSNSKYLSIIGNSAMFDTIYCFGFSLFLYKVRAYNAGIFILSSIVILMGLTVSFISFLLAKLTNEANADLLNRKAI